MNCKQITIKVRLPHIGVQNIDKINAKGDDGLTVLVDNALRHKIPLNAKGRAAVVAQLMAETTELYAKTFIQHTMVLPDVSFEPHGIEPHKNGTFKIVYTLKQVEQWARAIEDKTFLAAVDLVHNEEVSVRKMLVYFGRDTQDIKLQRVKNFAEERATQLAAQAKAAAQEAIATKVK